MNLDLKGKNALVCGSTQGLGLATAIELAELGANITLMARNEQALLEVTSLLPRSESQVHGYLVADFSDINSVSKAISDFISAGNVVHVLVNNTGGPAGGPMLEADIEQFSKTFSAHVLCNQLLIQAVVPGMKAAGFGRIVNIISTSVKVPIAGLGVSNTIRAAVANWAKTLATELAPFGITVNNVLPGYHKTARLNAVLDSKASQLNISREQMDQNSIKDIPMGRFGEVEEFGVAVAFLCSPAASYISGINLPVDGGRLGCL
ncbi:MAG: SDR family oxidoreductase [Bacteroidota bacterium]